MFDFVAYPLANITLLLYNLLGQNTMLAIAVLTVLLNALLLPLSISQQRSAKKMQELQPEIEKLKKKYGNNQEKLVQEQSKLMKEAGTNPLGGCLPLLFQFPIWFGLISAIRFCIPTNPVELLRFSGHIYKWLPGVIGLVPLQSTFLGMDLGQAPNPAQWWSYSLPILVFATSWLQQKLISPQQASSEPAKPSGDGQPSQSEMMAQQMKMMQTMMPLMIMFFSLQYATGLSIYFIISNAIRIVQYAFIKPNANKPEKKKK